MKSKRKALEVFAGGLKLYFFIAGFAILYFNWEYAKSHSFAEWLVFGEIKPSLQALIWPYYFIGDKPAQTNTDANYPSEFLSTEKPMPIWLQHISEANRYCGEVVKMNPPSSQDLTAEQKENRRLRGLSFYQAASHEVNQTDKGQLNSIYSGLGDRFKDDLGQGLEAVIKGSTENEESVTKYGLKRMEQWGRWYTENQRAILQVAMTHP